MFNLKNEMWLGSEASYKEILALEEMILAEMKAGGMQALQTRADAAAAQQQMPRLYSRSGSVGVVTVRGPLINTENDMTAYFNISTYPAVRAALAYAATDDQASQILLDIESPGGQVSGTNDVAHLVKQIDTSVKPVTAFSDSLVASAAYWIASGARQINVGETATVGSIGVIATQVNVHEALKKEGVKVVLVRAGENKQLGHPAEPVSEKAIAQLQAQVDTIHNIFAQTVSDNRSQLTMAARGKWADGSVFLGQQAVQIGLADAVSTFDQAYAKLVQNVDASSNPNNNANKTRGMPMKPRATLSPTLVAAIAAGAELNAEQQAEVLAARAAAEAADAEVAATAAATAAAEALATEQAAVAAKATADAKAAADAAAAAAAIVQAAPNGEVLAYLKAELKTANEAVTALTVKTSQLEAKVADASESFEKLCVIARNSINTMAVALGGHKATLENLTGVELIARHAAVVADFTKAFPVGGVASTVVVEDDKNKKDAGPSPRHLQLVRAAGLAKKK